MKERRQNGGLTDEQYAQLKAALRQEIKAELLADIFAEVGRSTVSLILWASGILLTAALTGTLAYFSWTKIK